MKAPPLHRSLLFWSGILVMVFIAWAWWISYRGTARAIRGDWYAENASGGVSLAKMHAPPGSIFHNAYAYTPAPGLISIELLPAPQWVRGQGLRPTSIMEAVEFHTDWEPAADSSDAAHRERRFRHLETDSWLLFIPHWLMLFLTAAAWSGMLLWWRRRMRRKMLP